MVAALFARRDSVYKAIAGVNVYDIERCALTWPGGEMCIAHPPCRAWGRYSHWAKPRIGEKELGLYAVECVRSNGGVLEHPAASKLFAAAKMPRPGELPDEYGGITVRVNQCDWGHRAIKPTWLYFVGVKPGPMPPKAGGPFVPVEKMGRAEREKTPPAFASWLVSVLR